MGHDLKTRQTVEPNIDVPYAPDQIVDAKVAPLGPAMAPLARWMPRLAIVNAFRQNSAHHPSGLIHTTCMKSAATPNMPTLLDLIGGRRGTEADR